MVGSVSGMLYGWRSGYTDGEVAAAYASLSFLKSYGVLRGGDDVRGRDRLVDFRVFDTAHTFVNGHSYSPLFRLMHTRADKGLLTVSAYWELNYVQPSIWREGFYPTLFDAGSEEEKVLKELKATHAEEYQKILKEHQKLREEKSAKKES
ncbi:MAG: hypothetical protein QM496_09660 [Verrucomicrobiota bacterium]